MPADALIGELNGGWKVIFAALAEERITMAGIASGTRGLLDVLMHELDERAACRPGAAPAGPGSAVWRRASRAPGC